MKVIKDARDDAKIHHHHVGQPDPQRRSIPILQQKCKRCKVDKCLVHSQKDAIAIAVGFACAMQQHGTGTQQPNETAQGVPFHTIAAQCRYRVHDGCVDCQQHLIVSKKNSSGDGSFKMMFRVNKKNMDEHTILAQKLLYPTDYSYRGPFWPFKTAPKGKPTDLSGLTTKKKNQLKNLFKALLRQGVNAKENADASSYKQKQAAFDQWVDNNCAMACTMKAVYKILIEILLRQTRTDDSFKKEVANLHVQILFRQNRLFTTNNIKEVFGGFRYNEGRDLSLFPDISKPNGVKLYLEKLLEKVQDIDCS